MNLHEMLNGLQLNLIVPMNLKRSKDDSADEQLKECRDLETRSSAVPPKRLRPDFLAATMG